MLYSDVVCPGHLTSGEGVAQIDLTFAGRAESKRASFKPPTLARVHVRFAASILRFVWLVIE